MQLDEIKKWLAEELNIDKKSGFHKSKLEVSETLKLYSMHLFYFTIPSLEKCFFLNPFF